MTLNQLVIGSSPIWGTTFFFSKSTVFPRRDEIFRIFRYFFRATSLDFEWALVPGHASVLVKRLQKVANERCLYRDIGNGTYYIRQG